MCQLFTSFCSAAIRLQSVWRMFIARTDMIHQLYSVLVIQAAVRGFFGMWSIFTAKYSLRINRRLFILLSIGIFVYYQNARILVLRL